VDIVRLIKVEKSITGATYKDGCVEGSDCHRVDDHISHFYGILVGYFGSDRLEEAVFVVARYLGEVEELIKFELVEFLNKA
jgi:hypothetical protein